MRPSPLPGKEMEKKKNVSGCSGNRFGDKYVVHKGSVNNSRVVGGELERRD